MSDLYADAFDMLRELAEARVPIVALLRWVEGIETTGDDPDPLLSQAERQTLTDALEVLDAFDERMRAAL
jgi:hypothetical protein